MDQTSQTKPCCKKDKKLILNLGVTGIVLAFVGLLIFSPQTIIQAIQQIPFPSYWWGVFVIFWGCIILGIVLCVLTASFIVYRYCNPKKGKPPSYLPNGMYGIFFAVLLIFGMIYFIDASYHEVNFVHLSGDDAIKYYELMSCNSIKYFEKDGMVKVKHRQSTLFSDMMYPLELDNHITFEFKIRNDCI
jgi:hypothetical protein